MMEELIAVDKIFFICHNLGGIVVLNDQVIKIINDRISRARAKRELS